MKRRAFLRTSGTALTLPLLLNGLRLSALPRSPFLTGMDPDNDRVLVLIQLSGGNDGLNAIIPIDQYAGLAEVRGNIMLPESSLLKVRDDLGLHPRMLGLQRLFQDEKLGIVQSVGYPNQNRSHFRSMDIWQSASPANEYWSSGWMGRYLGNRNPGYPEGYPNDKNPHPFAITMGSTVSETCEGQAANFSITLTDPFALSRLAEGGGGETPDTPYGEELQFLRTTIAQTNAYAETIQEAANKGRNLVEYPGNSNLAGQLKTIALLLAGGMQTKVFVAQLGGFDTHANQAIAGDTTTGVHAELLGTLSEAITAFQADLDALGLSERVVGLTFSEFGRQIRSNFSDGTDHGTAAPLVLFGSCVAPGILGQNVEVHPDVAPQEGVPMQFDFRDIYGSILRDWFEVAEDEVREVLYPEFQHLPILRDCRVATPTLDLDKDPVVLDGFPNPCYSDLTVSFQGDGQAVRLSLFDVLGQELQIIAQGKIPRGSYQRSVNMSGFAPGNYFLRLQMGARQKTIRIVRL